MISLLEKLCAPAGVSGNEEKIRELIFSLVASHCEKTYVDRAGNLICEKRGEKRPKNRVMFAAHMDEVGVIITNITEDGLLKFECVGGIDARVLLGKSVLLNTQSGDVSGVIGIVPMHLLNKENEKTVPDISALYIDIGADSKKDAEGLVSPGCTGILTGDFTPFGDGKILARALDDRCGCAVLVNLLTQNVPYDLTVVFSVQEEIGCRGAYMAACGVNPDIAVVFDSTTACDIADTPDDKTVCRLSDGAVISFMDRGCSYDRELFSLTLKTARAASIPVQLKRAVAGANDSASIQRACGGVRTAAVSLPCRYLHTPGCVIDGKDLTAVKNLSLALIEPLCTL